MKKAIIIIPAAAYMLLCCVFLQECPAQNVKSDARPGQNFVSVVNDIKCYQITYDQNSKEHAAYFEIIRKYITRRLKSNYIKYFKEGDVNLLFILNSDGSLIQLGVNEGRSTKDKKLIDIAVSSLKEASPFPPFPREFSLPQMPFSVVISFKDNSD